MASPIGAAFALALLISLVIENLKIGGWHEAPVGHLAGLLAAGGSVFGLRAHRTRHTGVSDGRGHSTGDLATVILMQLQAIPDARWGACIKGLKVGWDYEAQQTERGRATFWLDSDRMGDRFAEVTLQTSCDPGSAAPAPVSAEGVFPLIDVISETSVVEVAVVPVAPRHRNYATVAGQELKRAWRGIRGIEVTVIDSAEPASVRIESAAGGG